MADVAHALARSLIAAHGAGALAIAERAADNVRQIGMGKAKLEEWKRVIAAIKEMQKIA
jgi:hypothetical protein